MKKILILLTVVCGLSSIVYSQKWQDPLLYGEMKNGVGGKRIVLFATSCGTPSLPNSIDSAKKMAAIFFDSCNHKLFVYDPKTHTLDSIHLGASASSTDSLIFATRAWRQKGDDSLAVLIALRLLKSDTSSMLSPYIKDPDWGLTKSSQSLKADSSLLSTKNYANYLYDLLNAAKLNKSDTANKWVNGIFRTLGKDSIIFYIGGTRYAIKDSTGGGASLTDTYVGVGNGSNILSGTNKFTYLNGQLNIHDPDYDGNIDVYGSSGTFRTRISGIGIGSVETGYLDVWEQSTPATPSAFHGRFYFNTSGKPYAIDDGGTTYDLSAGGTNNSNVGSGYRLYQPSTEGIKTLFNGYAVKIDSSSNTDGLTFKADTTLLSTIANRDKAKDSILSIISSLRESTTSPTYLTADQDNYNPTGWDDATIVRISSDPGFRAITSFTAPTSSSKPQRKVLVNVGSYPVYFPSEHPDGTAANRVSYTRDFILSPNKQVEIVYDATSSRWRILGEDNPYSFRSIYYRSAQGSVSTSDNSHIDFIASGTGAANNAGASSSTLPSYYRNETGTTTTGQAGVYFSKTTGTFTTFDSAHIVAEALVSFPVLSDGTDTYEFNLAISGTPATAGSSINDHISIRYSSGINSGKFQLYTRNHSSSTTTADCGITVTAGKMYKLRLELDKSGTEARAYIDDVFVARVTTNLPQAGIAAGVTCNILKSAGGTSRHLYTHTLTGLAIYPQ